MNVVSSTLLISGLPLPYRKNETYIARHAALTAHVLIALEETASALIVSQRSSTVPIGYIDSAGKLKNSLSLQPIGPLAAFPGQIEVAKDHLFRRYTVSDTEVRLLAFNKIVPCPQYS